LGYSYATFNWLDSFTPPRANVLDLGSQDLYLGSDAEFDEVNACLARRNGVALDRCSTYPCRVPASDAWRRAGCTYSCVDIDRREGTIEVDLQSLVFPRALGRKFDLVMNAGTTEHLANPVGGLAFAHYACRVGGIIAHDVPVFGFGNHGLVNPTPKFWASVMECNGYDVLSAVARHCPDAQHDVSFYHSPKLDFIAGIENARDLSWMLRMAFRKSRATAFIPPMDWTGVDGKMGAALMRGSLRPFRGTWTRREISDAMYRALRGRDRVPIGERLWRAISGSRTKT
jgi:hypothetical protein